MYYDSLRRVLTLAMIAISHRVQLQFGSDKNIYYKKCTNGEPSLKAKFTVFALSFNFFRFIVDKLEAHGWRIQFKSCRHLPVFQVS